MGKFERLIAADDKAAPTAGEDGEPALPLIGATVLCFLLTFLGAFILFGL